MSEHRDIDAFVRAFLARNGPLPDDIASFNYIDSGHVDSMGVMHLAAAIEEHFDIELSDGDILSDEFRTAGGLVAIIARRRKSAAA